MKTIKTKTPKRTPRRPNRVVERMYRRETVHFIVRMWIDEPTLDSIKLYDVLNNSYHAKPEDEYLVAEEIADVPGISAVEVLNKLDHNGIVIYPDWH